MTTKLPFAMDAVAELRRQQRSPYRRPETDVEDNGLGPSKAQHFNLPGPCSRNNVVLITNQGERTWTGGIK